MRGSRPLTVSEMNQYMHHHLDGVDVHGPETPDTWYVLEDVPYGLVTMVLLGRMVGRPAILHESGMRILLAMYRSDFMNENELLHGLGLLLPMVGEATTTTAVARIVSTPCRVWTGGGRWHTQGPSDPSLPWGI